MVHALCNIFGRQFEAFRDENEVLPVNGGPCNGRIAALKGMGLGVTLNLFEHFKETLQKCYEPIVAGIYHY